MRSNESQADMPAQRPRGDEEALATDAATTAFPAAPPRCPRCGFDLRAAMIGWHDACPVEGLCTECGLGFRWKELLDTRSLPSRWNVEYCGWRRWPWACVATVVAVLLAWPLWTRLRMHMPWRPHRLAAFLGTLLLLAVILPWLGNGAMAVQFWWRHRSGQALAVWSNDPGLPARSEPVTASRGPNLPTLLVEALLLPWAGKSGATVVVSGRELPCPAPRELALNAWGDWLEYSASGAAGQFAWSPGGYRQWLIASASMTPTAGQVGPIPRGAGVFVPRQPARGDRLDWLIFALYLSFETQRLPALALQVILMPAIFAVLPVTRRRCRVRWEHIARATIYSSVPLVLLAVCLGPISFYADRLELFDRPGWVASLHRALTGGLPFWLALWWWVAIRKYLRMPHALPIAVLAAMAAWIASAILFSDVVLSPWFWLR